jgi:hypothetical protein
VSDSNRRPLPYHLGSAPAVIRGCSRNGCKIDIFSENSI